MSIKRARLKLLCNKFLKIVLYSLNNVIVDIRCHNILKTREMLTGAPGALVKDTKKGNYIVIIALKTV